MAAPPGQVWPRLPDPSHPFPSPAAWQPLWRRAGQRPPLAPTPSRPQLYHPGWHCRSAGGPTTRPQWRNDLASGPQATQGSPTITYWARPYPQLPGALGLKEGRNANSQGSGPTDVCWGQGSGRAGGRGGPFSEGADPAKAGGWGACEETQGVCVIKPPLRASGTPEVTHQPPTPVLPNQHKFGCKCCPTAHHYLQR